MSVQNPRKEHFSDAESSLQARSNALARRPFLDFGITDFQQTIRRGVRFSVVVEFVITRTGFSFSRTDAPRPLFGKLTQSETCQNRIITRRPVSLHKTPEINPGTATGTEIVTATATGIRKAKVVVAAGSATTSAASITTPKLRVAAGLSRNLSLPGRKLRRSLDSTNP